MALVLYMIAGALLTTRPDAAAIIQGADDQYVTLRQVEIARQECYCPVDVTLLQGAGHSPHREAPEATLNAISDFANAVLQTHEEGRAA